MQRSSVRSYSVQYYYRRFAMFIDMNVMNAGCFLITPRMNILKVFECVFRGTHVFGVRNKSRYFTWRDGELLAYHRDSVRNKDNIIEKIRRLRGIIFSGTFFFFSTMERTEKDFQFYSNWVFRNSTRFGYMGRGGRTIFQSVDIYRWLRTISNKKFFLLEFYHCVIVSIKPWPAVH